MNGQHIVDGYLKYKAHVSRQVYAKEDGLDERLFDLEKQWPEYNDSNFLVSRPAYSISTALHTSGTVETVQTCSTKSLAMNSVWIDRICGRRRPL